jgi:diketogulonate reductase-like aldo/keto reductase
MNTSIGNDSVLGIGLGMAKIGTLEKSDAVHIKNRLSVIERLGSLGKVFIDTSPVYGNGFSEKVLGDILPLNRERYFLATKYFPESSHTDRDLIESVSQSINRMKVEHIDLLQIHWPNPYSNLNQILSCFSSLKKNGIVRNLGLCNFENKEMQELIEANPQNEIISNQIELHIGNMNRLTNNRFSSYPKIIAYGSILQGRLTFSLAQRSHIIKLADKFSIPPAALALSILIDKFKNILPVLKISNEKHLDEILQIFSFKHDLFQAHRELENLKTETVYIEPHKITLVGDEFREPYQTFEEASSNLLNLFPSPTSLAERILKYNITLPVKVVLQSKDKFIIDPYDPFDQIKKFWAWRIAFPSKKVPVDIIE